MTTVVHLRPMTEDELAAYRPRAVRYDGEEHVQAGDWPAEEALARSEAEFEQMLPDGLDQRDALLMTAVDADRLRRRDAADDQAARAVTAP